MCAGLCWPWGYDVPENGVPTSAAVFLWLEGFGNYFPTFFDQTPNQTGICCVVLPGRSARQFLAETQRHEGPWHEALVCLGLLGGQPLPENHHAVAGRASRPSPARILAAGARQGTRRLSRACAVGHAGSVDRLPAPAHGSLSGGASPQRRATGFDWHRLGGPRAPQMEHVPVHGRVGTGAASHAVEGSLQRHDATLGRGGARPGREHGG